MIDNLQDHSSKIQRYYTYKDLLLIYVPIHLIGHSTFRCTLQLWVSATHLLLESMLLIIYLSPFIYTLDAKFAVVHKRVSYTHGADQWDNMYQIHKYFIISHNFWNFNAMKKIKKSAMGLFGCCFSYNCEMMTMVFKTYFQET